MTSAVEGNGLKIQLNKSKSVNATPTAIVCAGANRDSVFEGSEMLCNKYEDFRACLFVRDFHKYAPIREASCVLCEGLA